MPLLNRTTSGGENSVPEMNNLPDEGDTAFQNGDFAAAADFWQKQLQPATSQADDTAWRNHLVARLARTFICQRKYAEAEQLFESFPQSASIVHAVHVSILGETVGAGNFQKACTLFKNVIGEEPVKDTLNMLNARAANHEALKVKCELYTELFNWNWFDPMAEQFFQHFATILANRLRREKHYQTAAEIFEELSLLLPGNPFALACLLEVQMEAGDYLKAMSTLNNLKHRLTANNEADATFFEIVGLCYEAELSAVQGDLRLANKLFVNAINMAKIPSFNAWLVQDWSNEMEALAADKEGKLWSTTPPESFNYAAALHCLISYRNFHSTYGRALYSRQIEQVAEHIKQFIPSSS